MVALHLNNMLFCMKKEPSNSLNLELLKTVPVEVLPNITHFAAPPQWWHPHTTHKCNKWVYGTYFDEHDELIKNTDLDKPRVLLPQEAEFVCFTDRGPISRLGYLDASGEKFMAPSKQQVAIFDSKTHEKIDSIQHPDWVHDICLDTSKKFLATGSEDYKARIFNIETHEEICHFQHKNYVNSVCFNQSGKLLATVSGNLTIDIFAQYNDYTLWQIILKQTLLTWLLIKKPNKKINTVKKLLQKISLTSPLSYKELTITWSTFPEYMQNAIWTTMHHRIQTHGKTTLKFLGNFLFYKK